MTSALSRRRIRMIGFVALCGFMLVHDNTVEARTIEGTNGRDRLVGGDGGDRLFGRGQADTLIGNPGNDLLNGGGGADQLYGGIGTDTLTGGPGLDRFRGTLAALKGDRITDPEDGEQIMVKDARLSAADIVVQSTPDSSIIIIDDKADVLLQGMTNVQVSLAKGSNGIDIITFKKGAKQIIDGTTASDRLSGDDSNNTLRGFGGNDILIGSGGQDTLKGGNGADQLYGGSGADVLTGGAGQDRFRGTLAALKGDRISDLEDREQIMVKDGDLRANDIRLTPTSNGMKLIIEGGSRADLLLENVENAEATLRKAANDIDIITIDIKAANGGDPPDDLPGGTNSGPVSIILDTDFSGDVDDAGTLAVLNELHNRREARMLAVMSVAWNKDAVAGISAINNFYGNADIPIGRHARGSNNTNATYAGHIANRHKHNQRSQTAESSTTLYRKILANSEDNSVVVVTVGQLRNIEALLKSAGDGISNLNGKSLFSKKVKRLHIMGGEYPKSNTNGEANFRGSGNGVARYVVNNANVPIVFNGFEIGSKGAGYSTGDKLDDLPLSNPVVRAYHYFFEINPPSYVNGGKPAKSIPEWSIWDQIALIYAVRQKNTYFGKVTRGYNDISANGSNTWRNSPDSNQSYLTVKMDPKTFADRIVEPLMIK